MKSFFKSIVIFILTLEARLVLWKYKPKIIAVTGSVGKTATKDAIAKVLEKNFFVRSSPQSFNSEFGVPLTILGCKSGWNSISAWFNIFLEGLALILLKNHYPKVLVLEVGTDRPGDILRISKWLAPHSVVVTLFGEVPAHVEFFKSREALIAEKTNLVHALRKKGALVINVDDVDVRALGKKAKGPLFTFGFNERARMVASHPTVLYTEQGIPIGVGCKVSFDGKVVPLKLYGTVGFHYIFVALAALSVGVSMGVNVVDILDQLSSFEIPKGRFKNIPGKNETLIVDDSYNSSPIAAEFALRGLSHLNVSGRKIGILGDMLELGKQSAGEHRKIGSFAAHVLDILITVGPRANLMGEAALEQGMKVSSLHHFDTSEDAGVYINKKIQKGDVVLVKGSQGIRMERVVEQIIAEPKKKEELLVRQEKEWQTR